MIYLDSSAIVKLIQEEPESAALHEVLAADGVPPLFTSQLAITEVKRALHAANEPDLAHGAATVDPPAVVVPGHRILARPITAAITLTAGDLLPGSRLRSLDAIHVATAQQAGEALTDIITYDTRMADAAESLELPTSSPGSPADDQAVDDPG